jgi:hypothetical protein
MNHVSPRTDDLALRQRPAAGSCTRLSISGRFDLTAVRGAAPAAPVGRSA